MQYTLLVKNKYANISQFFKIWSIVHCIYTISSVVSIFSNKHNNYAIQLWEYKKQ